MIQSRIVIDTYSDDSEYWCRKEVDGDADNKLIYGERYVEEFVALLLYQLVYIPYVANLNVVSHALKMFSTLQFSLTDHSLLL